MRLGYEQIKEICLGAVGIKEAEDGVCLHRFTEEQEALYKKVNADFYKKTRACAGVKLSFETDSKSLFLKVYVAAASARKYFSIDIFADGKTVGYLDNFSGVNLPRDYTTMQLPHGTFSKNFSLGAGLKKVCIYLPWSVAVLINELSLDDGALVRPIKPKRKMLFFGDSITQGYDALRPSNRYTTKLAEAFGAEEINKGIAGEQLFPELANTREDFCPEYICVAYGTNDWSKSTEDDFLQRCYAFYRTLHTNYPTSRIFAITPIWRKDQDVARDFGEFSKVRECIQNVVKDFSNITCIDGLNLVPHDESCFGDLRLHPNDSGFACYYQNLFEKIKKEIDGKTDSEGLC